MKENKPGEGVDVRQINQRRDVVLTNCGGEKVKALWKPVLQRDESWKSHGCGIGKLLVMLQWVTLIGKHSSSLNGRTLCWCCHMDMTRQRHRDLWRIPHRNLPPTLKRWSVRRVYYFSRYSTYQNKKKNLWESREKRELVQFWLNLRLLTPLTTPDSRWVGGSISSHLIQMKYEDNSIINYCYKSHTTDMILVILFTERWQSGPQKQFFFPFTWIHYFRW